MCVWWGRLLRPGANFAVSQGEDLSEASVREVLEETGVRTSFAAVLAMRQVWWAGVGNTLLSSPAPVE